MRIVGVVGESVFCLLYHSMAAANVQLLVCVMLLDRHTFIMSSDSW